MDGGDLDGGDRGDGEDQLDQLQERTGRLCRFLLLGFNPHRRYNKKKKPTGHGGYFRYNCRRT